MKNKYISPIVEIYDYITEDVMLSSFGEKGSNYFEFPFDWAGITLPSDSE